MQMWNYITYQNEAKGASTISVPGFHFLDAKKPGPRKVGFCRIWFLQISSTNLLNLQPKGISYFLNTFASK